MIGAATILYPPVAAVCPIVGVAVGRVNDRSTWRVDFDPSASAAQRAAAANVIATFDLVTAIANAQTTNTNLHTDANLVDLKSKLVGATPAQIQTYVNNNVTDLASAKVLLAKILLFLAVSLNG